MAKLPLTRFYGEASLSGVHWTVKAEPHVLMMFKRVFVSVSRQFGALKFQHTPSNAELLEWIMVRYPLRVEEAHAKALAALNKHTRSQRTEADDVLRNAAKAGNVKTLLPLRDYQLQAVHLIKLRNALLCGDDLGLGKTAIALGAIAAGMRPAIIVCKTHLQAQWIEEAHKFLEGVKEHVVTKTKAYELPEHNFLVITYSKLSGWAEYLKDYKLIVFDEAQELRRAGTQKYAAANALCNSTPNRVVT